MFTVWVDAEFVSGYEGFFDAIFDARLRTGIVHIMQGGKVVWSGQ